MSKKYSQRLTVSNKYSQRLTTKNTTTSTSEVFIPERVMCSELSSAALIHLHVIEPGIFEVDDIGPNAYSTVDSGDMLNQIVRKGVHYDPEFIFHYPGGPYNRALDALQQIMVENKTLAMRDHMTLGQRTSMMVRRVSRLSFSPQVEPEVVEDLKEPNHYTTMEAMTILAQRPKKKRSRLESVTRIINQISSRIVNSWSVADDWDVVVSSIAEEERSTGSAAKAASSETSPKEDDEIDDANSGQIFSASKNLDGLV